MLSEYADTIRTRTNGGQFFYLTSDAKLSAWLGIPESEVKPVLDRLIAAKALRYVGRSRTGSHKFEVLPPVQPAGPAPAVPVSAPSGKPEF